MNIFNKTDVPEILGWKPVVMYDRALDQVRIANQADIDLMQKHLTDYIDLVSDLRAHLKRLEVNS